MAVMAIYRREDVSPELYQAYRTQVPVERVPRGALAHFYGREGRGFVVVDVWEDESAMWRFIKDKVVPATERLGVAFEPPQVIPLETIITTAATRAYDVPFETPPARDLTTAHEPQDRLGRDIVGVRSAPAHPGQRVVLPGNLDRPQPGII